MLKGVTTTFVELSLDDQRQCLDQCSELQKNNRTNVEKDIVEKGNKNII